MASGGTLLDHSLVAWGQESGNVTHFAFSMPVITAGAAGGAIKTGSYCDYRNLEPTFERRLEHRQRKRHAVARAHLQPVAHDRAPRDGRAAERMGRDQPSRLRSEGHLPDRSTRTFSPIEASARPTCTATRCGRRRESCCHFCADSPFVKRSAVGFQPELAEPIAHWNPLASLITMGR